MISTCKNNDARGIALVLVLSFMVLISVLALAFFSSVISDSQSSQFYSRTMASRELADSAVNLVMAQIKEATSNGPEVSWSSQPGMIRTYGTDGKLVSGYKLYSSDVMKLSGSVDLAAEVAAMKDWTQNPATFVDLNSPVADGNNVLVYPIVHPQAAVATDPADQLQGFKILSQAPASATNAAPMPVRWLYVLNEGQIVAPSGSGKMAKVAGATRANPIVGRIAFWTDDETCKVNVNTAAGDEWNPPNASYGTPPAGSYWDLPRTQSTYDKAALAAFQPTQGEFQRYPGHPATTYLSAVFPKLTKDQIGAIATRVEKGGSLGGTAVATGKVLNDDNRLYATIDELIFDPARGDQPISKERLDRSRFFLTAHSRAPELNLFNLPRVSVWPVSSDNSPASRTPFDRLIAFCSRIGGEDYLFNRTDADSKSADFTGRNAQLYSFLQRLTGKPIPGFGGNFLAKYGDDRDQILTEIFDYIRSTNLFDDNLEAVFGQYPTTGREFTDARSAKTSVNRGHGQVTPIEIGTTKGFGRFHTLSEIGLQFICTADPAVAASNVITGAGKNRTLQSVLPMGQKRVEALLIMSPFSPSQGWTALRPDMKIRVRGLENLKLTGASVPSGAPPDLGFPADGTIRHSAGAMTVVHGRSWGGNGDFRTFFMNDVGSTAIKRALPARGVMSADPGWDNADKVYPFVSQPFTVSGSTMSISATELTIEIYTDNALNPVSGPATLVQTLHVKLPAGNFPVPLLVTTPTPANNSGDGTATRATTQENWWSFSPQGAIAGFKGRLDMVGENPGNAWAPKPLSGCLILPEDTVRTVQVKHADYRVVAAMKDVPNDLFVPHRLYSTTSRLAHSFRIGLNFGYIQGADGNLGGQAKLVNTPYNWSVQPLIPAGMHTDADKYGDWDTGFSNISDGAYINKPDEGQGGSSPYYDSGLFTVESAGPTLFSPNRQMPSAGMFGSLPSQIKAKNPDNTVGIGWRTLLFRPDTSPASDHIGAKSPKDHLLLDLFWMPVVEPYAISEPFSTAGKINLNYQIAPFTYLERTTALRALLRSEKVMAIPTNAGPVYKTGGAAQATTYRLEVDADQTLTQFQTRFDANDLFRSAGEICDIYLVPEGQNATGMKSFWQTGNRLTGDNVRERPYTTLYPRLTTKSNTFSVHLRMQSLQQRPRLAGEDWEQWKEGSDVVTSEYRGSSLIERYIDFSDNLPDFAKPAADPADSVDRHCKIRTLMTRKFAP